MKTKVQLPTASSVSGVAADEDQSEKAFVYRGDTAGSTLVEFPEHPFYPLLLDHGYPEAGEHFAVLRSRVLSARAKSNFATLLITSPGRSEGKSLISMNLAITFGRLGSPRVLLVDCDLRVRTTTQLLQLDDSPGLGEYLRGLCKFDEIVHATSFSSVSVVAAGHTPDELLPAILEGNQWAEFLTKAKEEFDLILVDSVPTAAPIADCELTAAACDRALLVVHLRKTQREALAAATQELGRKLLGVVINNAVRHLHSDYYPYYKAKKQNHE